MSTPIAGLTGFDPVSNVSAFGYKDGDTYLSILEKLRLKQNETIVTLNETIDLSNSTAQIAQSAVDTAQLAMQEAAESAQAAQDAANLVNAPAKTVLDLLMGGDSATVFTQLTNRYTKTEADSRFATPASVTAVDDAVDALSTSTTAGLNARYTKTEADARFVQAQYAQAVNVKLYGAVGDGVADDSPALQAALDAGAGRTILIPAGTYMLNGPSLNIPANTRVMGQPGAVLKRGTATTGLMSNYPVGDTTTTAYNGRSNIIVEGITFDSDGAAAGRTDSNCLSFVHCSDITVRDCTFRRVRGFHHIELNAVDNALIDNCRFEGYVFSGSTLKEAVQIDCAVSGSVGSGAFDSTMAKNITVRKCWFGPDDFGNPAPQVAVGSHTVPGSAFTYNNIRVIDCVMDSVTGMAVRAYHWQDSIIQGCYAKPTPTASYVYRCESATRVTFTDCIGECTADKPILSFGTGSVHCQVRGCTFTGGANGVSVNASSKCSVVGNIIQHSTSYGVVADASTDVLIASNLIDGAGYTGGAQSAIRASDNSGPSDRISITGNRVLLHGLGTEVTAGVSAAPAATNTWVQGNDFFGLSVATTGTLISGGNRV